MKYLLTAREWSGPLRRVGALLALSPVLAAGEPPAPGERGTPADEPRPTQRVDKSLPPLPPDQTPVDPGAPLPPLPPVATPKLEIRHETEETPPTPPPNRFNPDPGGGPSPAATREHDVELRKKRVKLARPEDAPVPGNLALPRGPLERPLIESESPAPGSTFGDPFLPPELRLPRTDVREDLFNPPSWSAPENYPLTNAGRGFPSNTSPATDRWRQTGFMSWRRYPAADSNELPYAHPQPARWHYYRQSVLKGDLPYRGQDLFLGLTASSEIVSEDRTLTAPKLEKTPQGNSVSYASTHNQLLAARFSFQADFFRGETVFKPVDWLVRIRPVFSFNHVPPRSAGVVSLDGSGEAASGHGFAENGVTPIDPADFVYAPRAARNRIHVALQEAFVEKHLRDLSPNYDFLSVRVGNQTFNSDFRGFVFNDTNLGARLYGNYGSNRWQYNLALFDLREKDRLSDLNTFRDRGQLVAIANLYRQDFLTTGYTALFSFHASFDQGDPHTNTDSIIDRPAPLGLVRSHRVTSYYFGWAGDGHVGRWNLCHTAYVVVGRDEFNGLAGRPVNIFAQMAAVELSYDRDWIRFKASLFYASGDRDAHDDRASGFDSIVENANFAGGPFSYYVRQSVGLGGTAVGLKSRLSLLANLRPSKSASQQNFVNPGLVLGGLGIDADLTPKLRVFANANVLRFNSTDTLRALHPGGQSAAFGTDLSIGLQWRPLLTNNLVVSLGYGALLPSRGYFDLFHSHSASAATDERTLGRHLRSVTVSMVLTY